ncbi:MAG TPA: AAA family ATPase [Solirubrobacteraceae bacterium]
MPLQTTSARLLERDAELEALRRVLNGPGGLVVVDGPAGVGKTALLEAARDCAEDAGLLVLRARGAELERAFGFGVMRQLFDAVVRGGDPAALFTGAARFAAPLLDVVVDGAAATPSEDPFTVRHALYWLTANLGSERPLAMVVDDAHWADAASLGVLAHIANRLDGIPVALVVACRPEESAPALDALRGLAGELLHLAPLGADAAADLVRSLVPTADEALCRALHVATGGNPFLVRELARSLLDGGRVAEQSPQRVTREIAARLARLPGAAAALAGAASILGGGVALREAARLARLDEAEAAAAADALAAGGILRSVQPVEFLHPLVGAAVYAGLGPAARAGDHARAARLLADEAAPPERVAAQLLRCEPAGDRWAFERLLTAARLVAGRGAGDAAATYLRRALAEPPPPDCRAEALLELGAAEAHFDHAAAVEHLREALAGEIAVEPRFGATMLLAGLLGHAARATEAADVLEGQFDALAGRPDLLAAAEAAFLNITRIDPATRHRGRDVARRLREHVEAGEGDRALLGTIAAEMGMAGEPAERTAEVARRAVVGSDPIGTTAAGWSWYNGARALVMAERYDVARRALDRALESTRERGAVLDVGCVLIFRGELAVRVGDLAGAEVDARTLQEISSAYGWPMGAGFAAAVLGEVLIERDELEEAARVLTGGPFAGPAAALPHVYAHIWVLLARGRLRLAEGRPEDAAAELRECGRRALAIDEVSPSSAWRSELAHALLALGQAAEARRLAGEELTRARALGAPRALGVALRAAARVAGGREAMGVPRARWAGDGEEIPLLREAVAVLDSSPARLERARAQAELGAALRRAGDPEAAREPLRRAVDLAHRCSATRLEDAALAELRATGARPRRRVTTGVDALTPSERRIAELAAGGRQNREIAEALFVTTATVEYHLRNAYRKLGIASRTQLGGALAEP